MGRVGHGLRTRLSLFNKFGKLKVLGYAFCNYWRDGVQLLGDIYPLSPYFGTAEAGANEYGLGLTNR